MIRAEGKYGEGMTTARLMLTAEGGTEPLALLERIPEDLAGHAAAEWIVEHVPGWTLDAAMSLVLARDAGLKFARGVA